MQVLRRGEGRLAHFLVISYRESRQAIEAFAGADIAKAKYYPQDADHLLACEPAVQHYEVHASP